MVNSHNVSWVKQFANGSRGYRPELQFAMLTFQQLRSAKRERTTEKLRNFFKDESGASAVEYGLMVAPIAVVIIAVVNTLGITMRSKFNRVATAIGT